MNADVTAPLDLKNLYEQMNNADPCCTSFPSVDRFLDTFSVNDYRQALAQRRSAPVAAGRPLALYVHIPFCETQCHFCNSSPVITHDYARTSTYLRHLTREAELHSAILGVGQSVNQLHLSGGTPTFFSDAALGSLMDMLQRNFNMIAGGDYTIEVDPRTVNAARLDALMALGFNRLSIGVFDLDPTVQQAVHRIQPAQRVAKLFQEARQRDFDSINVDLMHGLPHQSPDSFNRTLAEVVAWRPDRIGLHAYEHQPVIFKPQRHIMSVALPSQSIRKIIHSNAMAHLLDAGYIFVGMGLFALPTDVLAIAKRQGRLHRNLQGFSPQPDCDLIGLGVSARSQIGTCYKQNGKTLGAYTEPLDEGLFPVVSGISLSRDDLIRRSVMMALMCQGEVSFESIELGYLIDFRLYFVTELALLMPFIDQGAVMVDDAGIQLTESGHDDARAVALVFDRYLQSDRQRAQFSKVI